MFVGGSLVDAGGHNILEPAVFGKPIVFGPHMQNFAEIAADVPRQRRGRPGARRARELETVLLELLAIRCGAPASARPRARWSRPIAAREAKSLAVIAQLLPPEAARQRAAVPACH